MSPTWRKYQLIFVENVDTVSALSNMGYARGNILFLLSTFRVTSFRVKLRSLGGEVGGCGAVVVSQSRVQAHSDNITSGWSGAYSCYEERFVVL